MDDAAAVHGRLSGLEHKVATITMNKRRSQESYLIDIFTPRPDSHPGLISTNLLRNRRRPAPAKAQSKSCELHSSGYLVDDFDQIKAQPPIIKIINLMQMISYSVQVIMRYFCFLSK